MPVFDHRFSPSRCVRSILPPKTKERKPRMNRRTFLHHASLVATTASLMGGFTAALPAKSSKILGVGMCDWNLGEACNPELIPKAREAQLNGLQVSVGTAPDKMVLRDARVRQRYLELGKRYGITVHSVAAGGILNNIPLATEPQSAVYVIDAIEAAQALGAKNILIAFFGNGDLRLKDKEGQFIEKKENGFSTFELNEPAVQRVVDALRQIAPRAEKAGVVIGFENTLTAQQNLEIIRRVQSPMMQMYYDVGNSTGNGYDIFSELRMLGNDHICEIHLKDWKTPMMGGEGCSVDMPRVSAVLAEIGYDKWLVLETSGRTERFLEDTRSNVAYVRKTFHMA
jgi:L-ribulose-5-phosphate 3-epimerase